MFSGCYTQLAVYNTPDRPIGWDPEPVPIPPPPPPPPVPPIHYQPLQKEKIRTPEQPNNGNKNVREPIRNTGGRNNQKDRNRR